uniref:Ribosome-recycling factor, chloroplastic n=1 Tax=Aegilops tauschii TaxID=37682 RepID=N1QQH1_AEGTA
MDYLEMTKTVAKLSEEGKVAIRNIRRDAIKAYDKLEKKITDEYMKKVEAIQKQKEQELSKV